MEFVSRADWGAAPAKSTTPLVPARVTKFVLHHTTGTYKGASSVRAIQKFHQGPERNWSDIGYNWLVGDDGTIFEGRGWGFSGAHARGHNSVSIGVAYIGDGSRPVPDVAKFSILRVAAEADRRFGSLLRVGHRDVGSTACPGDGLYRWWVSGPALPAAPSQTLSDGAGASQGVSGGGVAGGGVVPSGGVSGRPGPIPDLRDGWRRHMARMGWTRRVR
ncbi:MAG TPA: N-acetylmuramoyl-L-alanine amidase [Acidimicrobiia bacterium]